MQSGEFADFIAYFIPDYAEEISANYDEDIGAARARAEREVKADLPLGVETPGISGASPKRPERLFSSASFTFCPVTGGKGMPNPP